MEVEVKIRLTVEGVDPQEFDPDTIKPGDPLRSRVVASVEEAVRNAVQCFYGEGFQHDLEAQIALAPVAYTAKEVNAPKVPKEEWAVPAEVHSDDHVFEVAFDAGPWFEQATDEEIEALAAENWGSGYASDDVAQHCSDTNEEIAELFTYLERIADKKSKKDECGSSCNVDEDKAMAWLRQHRSQLATQIEEES